MTEAERIALTESAIARRGTVIERWIALTAEESAGWGGRASRAGDLLADQESVLDLGCGLMLLEAYLPSSTLYIPCDAVARDGRTIVCDLNIAAPPAVAGSAVAALGLLEYLHDPAGLMTILASSHGVCLVGYCMTDAPNPIKPRLAHGWVNNFTKDGIEELFLQSGWDLESFEYHNGVQGIWRLRSRLKE